MNILCVGGPIEGRVVNDNGPVYKFHTDQILSEIEIDDGLVVAVSSYRYIKKQFHYNKKVADVYLWEHSDPKDGMELIMGALSNLGGTK